MSDLRESVKMALESMEEGEYGHAERILLEALAQQTQDREALDHFPQENDGCPTEKSVLQRFWRGQEIPKEHYPSWFLSAKPVNTVNTSQERVDETAKYRHEPVGYVSESGKGAYILVGVDLDDDTPLYTAPPKRDWKGLTDNEIALIDENCMYPQAFARAIEAKIREKNT